MYVFYLVTGIDILNIQYGFNKPSFVFFVKVLKGIWGLISLQKSCLPVNFEVTSKLPLLDFTASGSKGESLCISPSKCSFNYGMLVFW